MSCELCKILSCILVFVTLLISSYTLFISCFSGFIPLCTHERKSKPVLNTRRHCFVNLRLKVKLSWESVCECVETLFIDQVFLRKMIIFDKQMYWIPVLICVAVGMAVEDFRVEDERNGM